MSSDEKLSESSNEQEDLKAAELQKHKEKMAERQKKAIDRGVACELEAYEKGLLFECRKTTEFFDDDSENDEGIKGDLKILGIEK